jgi:hypothetical protein
MSKVQEKDSTLLSNLSDTGIANELDSRLRDLEKNIAVAREFIRLADESYSELRHKWNLLQEEVRNKPQTHSAERAVVTEEKTEPRPRNEHHGTRSKKVDEFYETKSASSSDKSARPEAHAERVKTKDQPKKESMISSEDIDSPDSEKPSQPYRDPGRRRGKSSGHNQGSASAKNALS